MRRASRMPQLREYPGALAVKSLHNLFPAFNLFVVIEPGRSVPAPRSGRNWRGFGNNETAVGRTLRIVLEHHVAGNIARLVGTIARKRSHHHTVLQQVRSDL